MIQGEGVVDRKLQFGFETHDPCYIFKNSKKRSPISLILVTSEHRATIMWIINVYIYFRDG